MPVLVVAEGKVPLVVYNIRWEDMLMRHRERGSRDMSKLCGSAVPLVPTTVWKFISEQLRGLPIHTQRL